MGTYHNLPIFGVGEANAHRLVYEEDVRILVPTVRVVRDVMDAIHSAWAFVRKSRQELSKGRRRALTKLHEQSDGGRTPRASVCPEDYIVLVRIVPALEEVEEQVSGLDVDITRERPAHKLRPSLAYNTPARDRVPVRHTPDRPIAKV